MSGLRFLKNKGNEKTVRVPSGATCRSLDGTRTAVSRDLIRVTHLNGTRTSGISRIDWESLYISSANRYAYQFFSGARLGRLARDARNADVKLCSRYAGVMHALFDRGWIKQNAFAFLGC